MAYMQIKGIAKRYGTYEAVRGIDIDIAEREFVVIVGPSGCGKSTLLRMIAGLETISRGDLVIDGQRMNDVRPADRGIAMVFQSYALYPHKTVEQNMGFALKVAKTPKDEAARKIARAAEILQLGPLLKRLPKELSGGQRQRVAIARVLLKDAPILILDEATSALDSEVEAAIQEQLVNLMKGKTVIAIAHRLSTIAAMDRLVIMDEGRIVEQGSHAELLRRGGLYAELWTRQSGGFLAQDAAE
jgi:multiple sugar transport system ATP-binding protein